MKKLNIYIMICLLSTACYTASFAQKNPKKVAANENEKKPNDVDFAVTSADDGLFEVQAAELAKTKATSAKVKELAKQMAMDHASANEELKVIARKKSIMLPSKLGDKNQKKIDKLSKLEAIEFDKEYADIMITAHRNAIELFQKEADNGKDAEFKAWAAGKIATLKSHLKMAENTYDTVTLK